MEVMELKKAILTNSLPNMVVFTGDKALINIYTDKIKELFLTHTADFSTWYSSTTSKFSLIPKEGVTLIEDDEVFINTPALWDTNFRGVVFIYPELDKRSKFYKAFEKTIVNFEPLSKELLIGLLNNRISISDDDAEWLVARDNLDYYKIMNDVDKIKIFPQEKQQKLFDTFKRNQIIGVRDSLEPFEFVNAITERDKLQALKLLNKLSTAEIFTQFIMLYNSLKTQLQVQGGTETAEQLGINSKLYYVLSKKKNYNIKELCSMLSFIAKAINQIKLGELEALDTMAIFIFEYM